MLKRLILFAVITAAASAGFGNAVEAAPGQPADWQRFYHYPYVYYPHSFKRPVQYDHLYYRYSPKMRIPVFNKSWYNFYPTEKPYYRGHHFILDTF